MMNPPSPDAHASPRIPAGPSPATPAGESREEPGELLDAGTPAWNTPRAKLIIIEPLDVDGLLSFPPERPEEAPIASSDSLLDIDDPKTGVIAGATAAIVFEAIDAPAPAPSTAPDVPVPAHAAQPAATRRRKRHRRSHAAQTASRMIGELRRSTSEWNRALGQVRCRLAARTLSLVDVSGAIRSGVRNRIALVPSLARRLVSAVVRVVTGSLRAVAGPPARIAVSHRAVVVTRAVARCWPAVLRGLAVLRMVAGGVRAAARRDLPRRVHGVRVRLGSISGAVRGAMLRSGERVTRLLRSYRTLATVSGPNVQYLRTGRSPWLLVFGFGFAAGALSMALGNVLFDARQPPSAQSLQGGLATELVVEQTAAARSQDEASPGAAPAVPMPSGAMASVTPVATQGVTPTAPRADATEALVRGSEPNGPSQRAPEPPRPAVTNRQARESADDVAAVAFQGSLEIRSTPPGARVFVNGALAGTTPIVMDDLRVGSRAVRAELAGYESWSAAVTVVVNQRTVATAVMRPLPAP